LSFSSCRKAGWCQASFPVGISYICRRARAGL
jgi:hypothetical protein